MSARAPTDEEVEAGQAVYSPTLLAFYDVFVLRFSCRLAWRCPRTTMLAFYDRHVGARHLDVGVGTGYFLDHCRWPVEHPELTLLDLNPNSLRFAADRIERYRPRVVQANVLASLDLGEARFDSIGMNFLLHCLPGSLEHKAEMVSRNLVPYLAPGGVVFGSTILGRGVRHNVLGRRLMRLYNRKGVFSNLEDDIDGLERALGAVFAETHIEVKGKVALFLARTRAD